MLIIIAAHIPIFTLQRHEGRIFAPMAYSVTSALICSLIFSLTLVPLLCHVMLKKNLSEKENFLVHWCKSIYKPVLAWALAHRKKVVIVAALVLVASLAVSFPRWRRWPSAYYSHHSSARNSCRN
jgi:cobalt-zinc-cadmium resistance protein CzcA